jgi:heat shock protein HslJ
MHIRTIRARVGAFAFAMAALVVAGCGVRGEPSLIRTAYPTSLAGSAWSAVSVAGQPTVVGSAPTAVFTVDRIEGTTGCNAYFASYQYATGAIEIAEMGSTAIGCDGAIGATEQRFTAAMQGASSVSIDPEGRLVLDGSGGSITFVVAPQQADR